MSRTLLRRARLVGLDGGLHDIGIADGRIAAIEAHRREALGSWDDVVDVDGRFVTSGLRDNHVHFSQWALVRQRLDVSGAESAAHAARLVADRLAGGPPAAGVPLVGYGFRDALWADVPSRELLDASATHPVVLISGDLHCVWVNSAALRLFALDGRGSGVLREQDAFAVSKALEAVPDDVLDDWATDAAAAAAARGVVSVVELEMARNVVTWTRRVTGGNRSLRVECGAYDEHLDEMVQAGFRTGDPIPGGEGLVTMGPYKAITDGSLNTRTAWCHEPYRTRSGEPTSDSGFPTVRYDELVERMRYASGAGIRPAVHAIGDRANQLALDAFAEAGCSGSIEHAQLVASTDFARFKRLGVVASVQPEHAMDDRDIADVLWAGRTERAFAFESLLAVGATIRLGSDAPVAPLDPWVSMAAAISRSRDDREPWHPEQRVSAVAALEASTTVPRLEAGGAADLVVTELDPLQASDIELRRMPVAATMLAGRFTHRAI